MSDDAEDESGDEGGGIPAWVMTFADLMSLLMCFFVLLLSFSEMDVKKYKQIAGSMKEAFGVQQLLEAESIPKGTSVIMQEYSPGKPEPTPIQMVQQQTAEEQRELDTRCIPEPEETQAKTEDSVDTKLDMREQQAKDKALKVMAALKDEVDKGNVQVETDGDNIVIRVEEKGSFRSGSADLQPNFIPIMEIIRDVLAGTDGDITVEGHTDNLPIETAEFESNWALASGRAVAVAHALLDDNQIDPQRLTVSGLADTRPLGPNDTPEQRARNRRVEIIVQPGSKRAAQVAPKNLFEARPHGLGEELAPQPERRLPSPVFEPLRPEEIF